MIEIHSVWFSVRFVFVSRQIYLKSRKRHSGWRWRWWWCVVFRNKIPQMMMGDRRFRSFLICSKTIRKAWALRTWIATWMRGRLDDPLDNDMRWGSERILGHIYRDAVHTFHQHMRHLARQDKTWCVWIKNRQTGQQWIKRYYCTFYSLQLANPLVMQSQL